MIGCQTPKSTRLATACPRTIGNHGVFSLTDAVTAGPAIRPMESPLPRVPKNMR